MTPPEVTPVVIVGAGPTGLTAATLLAQQGIDTLVLERHPKHYPLPRAVHLDGEVYRLLQHLGVAAEFAQISRPARGMRLVDRDLNVIAELDRSNQVGSHGWPEANMFDQPDLELMLRKNLAQYPQARLLTGMEVLRIQDSAGPEDQSVLVVRDDITREETDIRARYVLGCDGANSLVRASIGADLDDLHFSEKWLVVDVRLDFELDVWDGVHQICDRKNPASFMQIGPRRYRWEFRLAPEESGVVLYSEERIRQLIARWIPPTEPGVTIVRKTSYTFRARVADRWRRGNTFLLGDAAHSTPPFIGQGMGAGLRDAANLAWKVALVEHGAASTDLLDTYEQERKPHVTNVIRTAVMIGNAMTGGNGRAGGLLQATLTKLLAIPGAAAVASKVPVPPPGRSALVSGRRPIGAMIPQHRSSLMMSDELLGQGFALVYRQRVDMDLARVAQQLGARLINAEQPDAEQTLWTGWLKKHKIDAALVRPDRVVIATNKSNNASWPPIFGKTNQT